MTDEDIAITIDSYGALLDRAIAYLSGAPHWAFVRNEKFARLRGADDPEDDGWHVIRGRKPDERSVRLEVTYAASDYEGYCDEVESYWVPISILTMSDDDFDAWKNAAAKRYEQQKDEEAAAQRRAAEAKERGLYEALRAKYG
jgi:hypothetical protein